MESYYTHFTQAQKEQARRTDIGDLLRSRGEELKKSGSEYVWRDGSDKITIRGNLWYDHYDRIGGDAISFVRHFYDMDYTDAIRYLLGSKADAVLLPCREVMRVKELLI